MIPLLWVVTTMAAPFRAADVPAREVLSPHERGNSLRAAFDLYTARRPPKAASPEQWDRRREELRRQVLDCLGLWPLPERLPLRVRVAMQRAAEGYTLQRLYWQVFPDVEASGWLYLPDAIEGRAPAVLCPHGHWDTGARHRTVQSRCIGLAQRGYLVLAVDSVHLDDYRTGVSPVGLMTWHNLRGLDLLVSREDVDPARIGCTGASGGGQQTMYLMAVEPRLAAAAPTVMISYFDRILDLKAAHCYCNHVPGIARWTDEPEMCAAFAPKPALYMCDTQDWTRWFPHEGFPEIRAIYELYGAQDRVECHQWDVGHDYTRAMRETMYRFFDRWLKGTDTGPQEEGKLETVAPEELTQMGPSSPTERDLAAISAAFLARRAVAPTDWGREEPQAVAARVRPALADLVGEPLADPTALAPDRSSPLARGLSVAVEVRGEDRDGDVRWLRVAFESEPGVVVPALVAEPPAAPGPLAGVVLALPGGKAQALDEHRDLVQELVAAGRTVMCLDHRVVGELAGDGAVWLVHGILWGRPVAAMAARDLRAGACALASMPEVASDSVTLVALDGTATAGLLAAALDGGQAIAAFACDTLGPTYRRCDPSVPSASAHEAAHRAGRPQEMAQHAWRVLPNLLTVADLPEVLACLAPRPGLIGGVVDAEPYVGMAWEGLVVQQEPLAPADLARWLARPR